jgi:hypothetical protein
MYALILVLLTTACTPQIVGVGGKAESLSVTDSGAIVSQAIAGGNGGEQGGTTPGRVILTIGNENSPSHTALAARLNEHGEMAVYRTKPSSGGGGIQEGELMLYSLAEVSGGAETPAGASAHGLYQYPLPMGIMGPAQAFITAGKRFVLIRQEGVVCTPQPLGPASCDNGHFKVRVFDSTQKTPVSEKALPAVTGFYLLAAATADGGRLLVYSQFTQKIEVFSLPSLNLIETSPSLYYPLAMDRIHVNTDASSVILSGSGHFTRIIAKADQGWANFSIISRQLSTDQNLRVQIGIRYPYSPCTVDPNCMQRADVYFYFDAQQFRWVCEACTNGSEPPGLSEGLLYPYVPYGPMSYAEEVLPNNVELSPEGTDFVVSTRFNPFNSEFDVATDGTGKYGIRIYELGRKDDPGAWQLMTPLPAPAFEYFHVGSHPDEFGYAHFLDQRTVVLQRLSPAASVDWNQSVPDLMIFRRDLETGQWGKSAEVEFDDFGAVLDKFYVATDGRGRMARISNGDASSQLRRVQVVDAASRLQTLQAIPRAGSNAQIRSRGVAGAYQQMHSAHSLLSSAFEYAYGALWIGVQAFTRTNLGHTPGSGYIDTALPLSSLAGETRYFQSFHYAAPGASRQLSEVLVVNPVPGQY